MHISADDTLPRSVEFQARSQSVLTEVFDDTSARDPRLGQSKEEDYRVKLPVFEGPLDLLGALIGGRDHEALAAHTIDFELEPGLVVRVLALEMIIALKEELGGEKDLAVLPVLRRTLAELRKPRTDL